MSKSGNQDRIEVLGCAKPILLSFVTGYVHSNTVLDIASFVVQDEGSFSGGPPDSLPPATKIISALQTTSSSPQYLYQANAADTIVGPTIIFDTSKAIANIVKKIQLSLVFIGLKTFPTAASSYPQNIPDSFIVAIGGVGYTGTAIDTLTAGALAVTVLEDALKTGAMDLNDYNGNTNTHMGHSFCGFTSIIGQDTFALLQSITDGASSIDPEVAEPDATGAKSIACLFIATKAACVNEEKQIISPFGTTSATTPVVVTYNRLNNTISENVETKSLYSYTISNYAGVSAPTVSIVKNYPIPAGKTELVFYLEIQPWDAPATGIVTPATATELSYVLNIGGVEYPVVYLPVFNPAPTAVPYYRKYAIHVPAGTTNLPINITYTITSPSASVSTGILSGLFYFDKVIDNNNNCGSTCQEVAGKTTGVTIATNPPACILCSNDLF